MSPENACHEEKARAHLRAKIVARRSSSLDKNAAPDQWRGAQEIFVDDVPLAPDLVAGALPHREDSLGTDGVSHGLQQLAVADDFLNQRDRFVFLPRDEPRLPFRGAHAEHVPKLPTDVVD